MATYIIKTPDIGEGIAEVELVAWHVKAGDTVALDQVLADVMTDKATVEVPSPVAGIVISVGGTIGQTVAVGSELVRLEVQGAGNAKDQPPPSSRVALASGTQTVQHMPVVSNMDTVPDVARCRLEQSVRAQDVRPIASPAVRRSAWELGVNLALVTATGTAGRITHADVQAFAASQPDATRGPLPPSVAVCAQGSGREVQDVSIPVIGLRRKIAMKMQDSKRRIPHFTYVEEVDVTEIEVLRERLNVQWGNTRGRLTFLPLLVAAMVLALRNFPQMNARFDDDVGVVTRYGDVHLGIATQTDNGLMVPVLRRAQANDLWANSAEIGRVAQAARSGRATREELTGSTITITSLGALGGIVTTPVINHPEVAIVGVNRMVDRPVVLRGAVVVRKMMNLSSSFDHRVVDGLDAAKFVQAIRSYLEVPATLFVD